MTRVPADRLAVLFCVVRAASERNSSIGVSMILHLYFYIGVEGQYPKQTGRQETSVSAAFASYGRGMRYFRGHEL